MKYTVREYGTELHIMANEGLVSASISERSALRARKIIGRDLLEGEKFYWLNKIFNKSAKKGEGTELLQFVIDLLEKRNAIIGLIASPEMPRGTEVLHRQILENRLIAWYVRHGFQNIGSRYNILVRSSDHISYHHRVFGQI